MSVSLVPALKDGNSHSIKVRKKQKQYTPTTKHVVRFHLPVCSSRNHVLTIIAWCLRWCINHSDNVWMLCWLELSSPSFFKNADSVNADISQGVALFVLTAEAVFFFAQGQMSTHFVYTVNICLWFSTQLLKLHRVFHQNGNNFFDYWCQQCWCCTHEIVEPQDFLNKIDTVVRLSVKQLII